MLFLTPNGILFDYMKAEKLLNSQMKNKNRIEKFTMIVFLGKLQIKQPSRGYRIGIDTVLLATQLNPRLMRRFDLGCGVGGISLCLLTNHLSISVVGMDLDRDLIKLAKENNLTMASENDLNLYGLCLGSS